MYMDVVDVPVSVVEQAAPASYLQQIAYLQEGQCPPLSVAPHRGDPLATGISTTQADFAFRECLEAINDLLKKNQIPLRTAFISYAWEDESSEAGRKAGFELQCVLKRLSEDLSRIAKDLKSPSGDERPAVFLDVEDNTGHIENWMSKSIARSDYFLIVGTPRYQQRALSNTNVAFEYQAILKKIAQSPLEQQDKMLVPLLYKGSLSESFPMGVSTALVRSLGDPQRYVHQLLALSDPLGLVPHLYPELGKTGILQAEYKALIERLQARLELLLEIQKHSAEQKKESPLLSSLRQGKANRSQLPRIEQQFIGRSHLFKTLGILGEAGVSATTVFRGMAGVGKTTIVLQQAHNDPRYSIRLWFRAGSADSLSADYMAFAKNLGYGASDLNEAKTYVNEYLAQYPGWLVVFDDAPDFPSIKPYLPPQTGSVMLTTRYRGWPTVFRMIEVDLLEPRDAVALLQSLSTVPFKAEELEPLAKRLGYLPLALRQAGVYMERTGIGPTEYLRMYHSQEQRSLLLSETEPEASSVAGTWTMTLQRLKKEAGHRGASTQLLLQIAAYVEADHIPRSVFVKALAALGTQSASPSLEASVISMLARMKDYSLLSHKGAHMAMHPLLQDVIRAQHPLTQKQYVQLCEVLHELFWEPEDFGGEHKKTLLPHLLRLKEHVHLYNAQDKKVALSFSKILSDIGRLYQYEFAKASEAKAIFEEVLWIQERYQKPTHPEIALTLRNLASSELSLGKGYTAKTHLERALQIQKKYYGLNHAEVAETLINLGRVYSAEGDFLRHKTLLLEAQSIYGKGPDLKIAKARTLMELAQVQGILGEQGSSKTLFEQALDIYQQHYGRDHPAVAVGLRYLANAYGELGDCHKRKILLKRALKIQEHYHGLEHPEVALTLVDLGNVEGALGEPEQAKYLLERALFIQQAYYGFKHLELVRTLANLGNARSILGDFESAKVQLERALDIQKAHPYQLRYADLVFTLVTLGNVQGALGNVQANKALLEQALAVCEHHRGLSDLKGGMIHMDLGILCESLQEIAKSRAHFKRAYEIFVKHYGAAHLYTQQALKGSGMVIE